MLSLLSLVVAQRACDTPLACSADRTFLGCDEWCFELRDAGEAACNAAYKICSSDNDCTVGAIGARTCYSTGHR